MIYYSGHRNKVVDAETGDVTGYACKSKKGKLYVRRSRKGRLSEKGKHKKVGG